MVMQCSWDGDRRTEKRSCQMLQESLESSLKTKSILVTRWGVNLLKLRVKKLEFKLFFIHKFVCLPAKILQGFEKLGLRDKGN